MLHSALEFNLGTKRNGVFSSFAVIPECQILFVGPLVCTRHDILTSMLQIKDKIAHLCVSETDVIMGNDIRLIEKAASELVEKAGAKAIVLVTCCQNALIGTDFDSIKLMIREKLSIPVAVVEINRLHMFKAPKGAKLISCGVNDIIADFLIANKAGKINIKEASANIIGPSLPIAAGNELFMLLNKAGYQMRHISSCENFDAFLKMSRSSLNIVTEPEALAAAKEMETQLGIPWIDMTFSLSFKTVCAQYLRLSQALNTALDVQKYIIETNFLRKKALGLIGRTPIIVDGKNVTRPFTVAHALIEYGFCVCEIRFNEFNSEENSEKHWIEEHASAIPVHLFSVRRSGQKNETVPNEDHFMDLIKARTESEQEFVCGFALIRQLFESLISAYVRRLDDDEQTLEKAAASGS
jgi:nitrogenase molybdenum-iron protein alpha/beta subunit